MKEIDRWIRSYDAHRVDPYSQFNGGEGWHSTRFNLESMSWDEIRDLEVPGLINNKTGDIMKFGEACHALKRSWAGFKINKRRDGIDDTSMAYQINRLQYYLGIPMTDFGNLEWVTQQLQIEEDTGVGELSKEEIQLKIEEKQEEDSSMTDDLEEEEEEDSDISPAERALYAQLRKEEHNDNVNRILGQLGINPDESAQETNEEY